VVERACTSAEVAERERNGERDLRGLHVTEIAVSMRLVTGRQFWSWSSCWICVKASWLDWRAGGRAAKQQFGPTRLYDGPLMNQLPVWNGGEIDLFFLRMVV